MSSPDGPIISGGLLDRIFLSIEDLDHRIIPKSSEFSRFPNAFPSQDYCPGIFKTKKGYRDGYIIGQNRYDYDVIFLHDEHGNQTVEKGKVKLNNLVETKRIHHQELFIYIPQHATIDGYVYARKDLKGSLGTGIRGFSHETKKCKDSYPIFRVLSLHNDLHNEYLIRASSLLCRSIMEDLPITILDKIIWLINIVLMVDDYPRLSTEVIHEAIHNFVLDYTMRPEGSQLRHPINYILEILRIDGIWSERACVSYIS